MLKRFVSEDPIGLVGGLNLYAYVRGNPVSFNDPSGLLGSSGTSSRTSECFRKCLDDTLAGGATFWTTYVTVAVAAIGSTSYAIAGGALPAGMVGGAFAGGYIGSLFGGASAIATGVGAGIAVGTGVVTGAALVGAGLTGYVVGSFFRCAVVCANDPCYY